MATHPQGRAGSPEQTSVRASGREDIVDRFVAAAVELMTIHPPSAITGRQLAGVAGLNYGLLHRHLGTKEAALHLAIDRLTDAFIADAFIAPDGLPRPNSLSAHVEFWKVSTLVALDRASFAAYHPKSPVVERYVVGLARARPDLERWEQNLLVALSSSLHLGLSLYRSMLCPVLGLDPTDPRIDDLFEGWVDGLHTGRGPLGTVPDEPRTLRVTEPPPPRIAAERGRRGVEERLIEAGARLLSDRAPSAISGRDLARAAGVNYGLIHHYFGSKDEVLARSLEWHRRVYFEVTTRDPAGPDYFEVGRHPGFVRALTWAALDGETVGSRPALPTVAHLLARTTARHGVPSKNRRVAMMASYATQIAWALFEQVIELGIGARPGELSPYAAALLHRLVNDETVDRQG